ncbi:hypothetical protein FBUS_01814 [Fasciolopsis buskii]|uniref:MAM domain-containing protein n=1 Tax=Fasciolopsis buskii TaxID=27845 RepID=A0A8E0VHF4_9TREM|nr:hypothetical protein FBUS_01814 [Fasciolopsis buski]
MYISPYTSADSSPKPVHMCPFTTDTCGWSNDLNSWFHRWELMRPDSIPNEKFQSKTDSAMICLPARPTVSTSGQAIGSSLGLRSKHVSSTHEVGKPIQSTLWSPPIVGGTLGCLVFTYRYWSGPASGARKASLSSGLNVVNGSSSGFSLALLPQPEPLHVCDFTAGTCGWINDPNSWNHRWEVIRDPSSTDNSMVCLSSSMASDVPSLRSPWSRGRSIENSPSENTAVQSRLWSPPVRTTDQLLCLMFTYSLRLNKTKFQSPKAAGIQLALLRRQER